MYLAAGTFKDVRDGPWHILTDYTVNHLPYCNQEGGGERGLCSALLILKLVPTYIPAALRMSMMAYLAFSLLLSLTFSHGSSSFTVTHNFRMQNFTIYSY